MNAVSQNRTQDGVTGVIAVLGLAFGLVNGLLDLVPFFVPVALLVVGLIAYLLLSDRSAEAGPGPSAGV